MARGFSGDDLPQRLLVPVTARGPFDRVYHLPVRAEQRDDVLAVEETLRGAIDEVEVRPDLLSVRGGVVGIVRGVAAGQEVAAGGEATPDVF
ncbi:MAG: hypothetical protein M3N33_03570 [Actinomycetota bacterium]|nr:hypothetical protein [Actinomycetota bacterium]